MADLNVPVDYKTFRAAGERGSAPFIAVTPPGPGQDRSPLILYIAFKVESDDDQEHFSDIDNQVATIHAMNTGVYDEYFPELRRDDR